MYILSEDEAGEEVKTELDSKCYKVKYADNVNAGEASITVTGIEEEGYCEDFTVNFTISPKSLNDAQFKLTFDKTYYNGNDKKPIVTVVSDKATLVKYKDFKVTYSNYVEIGTGTALVTGINNYTGTKKLTFKIVLKEPNLTTSAAYNSVTVKWNTVAGATKYSVQRSLSKNSGFKTIKEIKDGKTVKYVDKDVTFNKTYYYRIIAHSDKGSSYSKSKVVSCRVRPAKVGGVTIKRASYNSLKISWNKVAGATGYRVYRSLSEDGTYEKVGEVKAGKTLAYTDKNLVCGRTYYYHVRAYRTVNNTKYYGLYSDTVCLNTKPAKASWNTSSISYDATSVSLKWKKAAGAAGYQIYRSTEKDGEYKLVKTISKASTTSWKNTGLTKSQRYYYKVRAYRKCDGETIYGAFSDVYTREIAGWRYSTYDGKKVKYYYNAKGQKVKDVRNIIGKQDSYEIRVNKSKCAITIYAKDGDNGYIIPVVAFICSTGAKTPVKTVKTPQKLRWATLMGPSYGQWSTRISGSYLFHSVTYSSRNNNTLSVSAYNKLGTMCSHGCVRLTAGDAKWMYDNCPKGTTVTIYNSSKPGPLGKPKAYKLPSWHRWDPTDPTAKSKCKSRGCH